MKLLTAAFMLMISLVISAQSVNTTNLHRWKPLVVSDKEKIWYDASMVDSMKGSTFDMWILQMHKPPLKLEDVKTEVYRSKILYGISLQTVKYGILKAVYYDVSNKEIGSYVYDNAINAPDNIKYTYPILENSFLYTLIKELFKKPGDKVN